jgi:hypothetical protein
VLGGCQEYTRALPALVPEANPRIRLSCRSAFAIDSKSARDLIGQSSEYSAIPQTQLRAAVVPRVFLKPTF